MAYSNTTYSIPRFQDIAGSVESTLSLPLVRAESSKDHPFQLEVFGRVWLAWQHCWSPGVLIPALTHRFWKLSLQVLYIHTHSVHHMIYYTIMTLYIAPPPPPRYSCGQLYGLRDFVQSVQRFVIIIII